MRFKDALDVAEDFQLISHPHPDAPPDAKGVALMQGAVYMKLMGTLWSIMRENNNALSVAETMALITREDIKQDTSWVVYAKTGEHLTIIAR